MKYILITLSTLFSINTFSSIGSMNIDMNYIYKSYDEHELKKKYSYRVNTPSHGKIIYKDFWEEEVDKNKLYNISPIEKETQKQKEEKVQNKEKQYH